MTPEKFVTEIRKSIVDENLSIYESLFNSTDASTARDPYWIRASSLFAKLDDPGRSIFFEVVRQVMVDTISNLLAVLDGVSRLENQVGDFRLSTSLSTDQLNGELHDRFLELEEDERK